MSDSHQVVVPLKHLARDGPGIVAACGWLWIQNPKNGAWFRIFVKAHSTELCIVTDEKVCDDVIATIQVWMPAMRLFSGLVTGH